LRLVAKLLFIALLGFLDVRETQVLQTEPCCSITWYPVWQFHLNERYRIRYPIGNGLYLDSAGNLYLKVRDRWRSEHVERRRKRPDSTFLFQVAPWYGEGEVELIHVVDTATFSPVNDRGYYYQDASHIYLYPLRPRFGQFFTLRRAGSRFLDEEKEYLLADGDLYSDGELVRDFDARKARVVRFRKKDGRGYREFITDGKVLLIGEYAIDEERLHYMEDIFEPDRERIRRRYVKPDPDFRARLSTPEIPRPPYEIKRLGNPHSSE
jgi:hypothetical protein